MTTQRVSSWFHLRHPASLVAPGLLHWAFIAWTVGSRSLLFERPGWSPHMGQRIFWYHTTREWKRNAMRPRSPDSFPAAVATGYRKFSGLKQHEHVILQFWKTEVQNWSPQSSIRVLAQPLLLEALGGSLNLPRLLGTVSSSGHHTVFPAPNLRSPHSLCLPPLVKTLPG